MNSNVVILRTLKYTLFLSCLLVLTVATAFACPPFPGLDRNNSPAAMAGRELPTPADLHSRGISTPADTDFDMPAFLAEVRERIQNLEGVDRAPSAATPFRVLGLLVDFSDNVSQVSATYFDSMIFSVSGNTVHDWFDEVSYAQIDFVTVNLPSSLGWQRAPQTYDYYVDNNYGIYSSYPHNSQKLIEDVVDLADASVDYSVYDNDGNGYLDILLVVHAGSGAEYTGSTSDMWSHKWGISPRNRDGVYISTFTVQPEYWSTPGDMTIGVYCHELCHGFGLPDLYDTDDSDGSANGIGKWGIMAYGSWNGSTGSSPAHPCAWSRIDLGFASATNIESNTSNQSIADVATSGEIYRLWSAGAVGSEYFLVENRQRVGYDNALPGTGLLIYHVDDSEGANTSQWYPGLPGADHYRVALEQADGLWELDHGSDYGDNNDPFRLNTTSDFNGASTPSSESYTDGQTGVAVENISASADTMTADLVVGIAAGIFDDDPELPDDFTLAQNYPNPFNPMTRIDFDLSVNQDVTLEVLNVLGQHVATLYDGPAVGGVTTVIWDATDDSGNEVASGTYFYRLQTEHQITTKKMLLLK